MNQAKNRPEALETAGKPSFYEFKVNGLDGTVVDFSKFKGKKVLIVNTASECGFTPQYAELQKLHEQYGSKVTVIGVPSNDFGGQEPGDATQIQNFCQKNFGVTFQMLEKATVKGSDKHPLYQWLSDKSKNGWNDQEPKWNFSKYLINEKGELVKFYPSSVSPMSKELLEAIK
ncbi:MAG TPA: glutathione peroxidase [Cytophagaceae bacterium]